MDEIDFTTDMNLIEEVNKELIEDSNEKSPFFIFEREGQVVEFMKHQPIFYDKSGMWWIWDKKNNFWEYCNDDVDILNSIRKIIGINTMKVKEKTEITNALKQIGRERVPEENDKNWIQFKDKIVDLETGEEFKASPKYFMTNPIPWKVGTSEDTPILDRYFREWVVSDGLQDESKLMDTKGKDILEAYNKE